MRYIIEIEEVPYVKRGENALYRAKGFNALVFDKNGLDKLTPLDKALSNELGEAYQKGFEAGQHEATTLEYQQGLNDAWACAKKIFGYEIDGGLPLDELRNVFGVKDVPFCTADIFRINTASEALAKIKAYEEQQKPAKIVVGDEVRNTLGLMDNAVGFVIGITIEGDYNVSRYIDGKFKTGTWRKENCVKTGKHSDAVVQLLAEMEGGAE